MDLVGFTLIVDDIVNPDGKSSMGRLGGGGPQTMWGFQLQRRQAARVGLAAGIGPDVPPACLEWLQRCGIDTAGLICHEHKTPRAWQVRWRTDLGAMPACRSHSHRHASAQSG